ncbi:MAG: hypothetical protein OEM97_09390 [Acidimicrobiia bacterium]|nr:hypothetical protein [Acidimicrobiia bacterium]
MKLLVVCAGNVGRSPLGEALVRWRLADALGTTPSGLAGLGIEIISRGTRAPSGIPVSPYSVAIAAERGLDLAGHRSHRLEPRDLKGVDQVLCMDRSNVADVVALVPDVAEVTALFDPSGSEIPDPRYEGLEFHRSVADAIDRAVVSRLDGFVSMARRPDGGPGDPPG